MFNPSILAHFGGAPELLLLDLDGTLVNSIPDLTQATNALLAAKQQPTVRIEQCSHWVGNGIDMLVRRALAAGDEDAALALPNAAIVAAREVFDRAYLQVLTAATGAYPGVESWLNAVDAPKVLITNKARKFTEPLLNALGWQQHFVQILCGDDLAEKKPSPLPLLHACQTQGIDPAKTLMIGDSRHDIAAAKAANIAACAVSYGYNHGDPISKAQPNWVVDNLMEMLAN